MHFDVQWKNANYKMWLQSASKFYVIGCHVLDKFITILDEI